MSETDASPRVRSMFSDVRRSLMPAVVQSAYAEAKASFDRKDPNALAQFDRVLVLLKDHHQSRHATALLEPCHRRLPDISRNSITSRRSPSPGRPALEAPVATASIQRVMTTESSS